MAVLPLPLNQPRAPWVRRFRRTAGILLAISALSIWSGPPVQAENPSQPILSTWPAAVEKQAEAVPLDEPVSFKEAEGMSPLVYCFQGKIIEPRLVVVDKFRQRFYVFNYLGRLSLEYEFPCATGEQVGDKNLPGDERTPEGVYFITHRYKDNKITIFGDRALHLDYPNACDQEQGKEGDGIYIHGTNRPLKPRSTNGCVVLDNRDLSVISPILKDQSTPILVVDRMQLPRQEDLNAACDFVQRVKLDALGWGRGAPVQEIALASNEGRNVDTGDLARRLHGLEPGRNSKINTGLEGLALFGVGDQWVLVARQWVKDSKGRTISLTRRHYMAGRDLASLNPVRGRWILADNKAVDLLGQWLPQAPVLTASAKGAMPLPQEVKTLEEPPAPKKAPAEPPKKPAETPPKPSEPVKPAKAAAKAEVEKPAADPVREIRNAITLWASAWQKKQLNRYISYYAPEFRDGKMDLRGWREQKAYLNKVYKIIEVRVADLKIKVDGRKAVASFIQFYRSDWHRDVGRKELDLVKNNGDWKIVAERWKALPNGAALLKNNSVLAKKTR